MTMTAPPPSNRPFMLGIPAVILLAALLTMIGVGLLGTLVAQDQLGEARAAKAAAVAEAVQHDLERAIGYGIPLERIEGVGAYLHGIAGRNPDLGFLAVTGAAGARLHGVPLDGLALESLDALAASLRGVVAPDTRSAAIQPLARDGFLIVRLPLHAASGASSAGPSSAGPAPVGHVLVGVQPGRVRSQIAGELVTVALGVAAVLLLLAEVAGALASASFRMPLTRLARVMDRAVAGDFATLIGRRPRDQVGRVLYAFNAAIYSLHDRRQRFAAHADEVRGAVFDPEVARAVERARADALIALGPGLETAPRRIVDARASDVRAYIALAVAAAALLVLAGVRTGSAGSIAALAIAALAGAIAAFGVAAPWRRLAALLVALGVGSAALLILQGTAWPGLLTGALCGGLAAGLALAYAHRQVGEGVPVALRAALAGIAAAVLWASALGWDSTALAGSALLLALLAALTARPFVISRS